MSEPPNERDRPDRERNAEHQWLEGARRDAAPQSRSGSDASPHAAAPRVVVCDDGELNDVCELLAALDVNSLRVRPAQVEELLEWERPTRLFITTVRVALSHPLALTRSSAGAVSIAIADDDAHTLCTAMLRRGFRYVVRRPVHPEALRLLLMQVLYAGPENRLVARFPFGAEVGWRRGLRSGSCAMTEISAHGCRLLTKESFPLDSRLRLRVPAALTGERDLRLRGRVVRRDLLGESGRGPRTHVAVQFEGLSARAQAHLDALLAERSSGPAAMRDRRTSVDGARRERRARSRFSSLAVEPALPPLPSRLVTPVPENDRRRRLRGLWHQEVVALDEETAQVLHVLIGTDLSPGGLRVEPHPLLRIGDRLKLALYDADEAEPLLVEARVAREDGRRGWGLIFQNVPRDVAERLESMVLELPPVSALSDDDDKPQAVVLGEIMAVGDESDGA